MKKRGRNRHSQRYLYVALMIFLLLVLFFEFIGTLCRDDGTTGRRDDGTTGRRDDGTTGRRDDGREDSVEDNDAMTVFQGSPFSGIDQ